MENMKKLVFILIFSLFLYGVVLAVPYFHDPLPQPDTYIYGKDDDVFQISVTEADLNTSTVKLHIRVEDPTSTWSEVLMSCYQQTTSEWICNTTVPGLYSLVENGNWLLYYFDGYDTNGEYGNYGNSTNPLRVRVDRTGPTLSFVKPKNTTFCSGIFNITLNATDELSEVNGSSVSYSFDNSTWKSTHFDYIQNLYVSDEAWDTTQLADGETVTIYARASDVLGNWRYIFINTTVENQLPELTIDSPSENDVLSGTFTLQVTARDSISGISEVSYSIAGHSDLLSCGLLNGTYEVLCSYSLDTTLMGDGEYNLTFNVADAAGNSVNNSISVIIDNLSPQISILSPTAGQALQGVINISAEVVDEGVGVLNVTFRWETDTTAGEWEEMNCTGDPHHLLCYYSWNSSEVNDGTYTLRVQAFDKSESQNSVSVQVGISNLSPVTTISTSTTTTIANQTSAQAPITGTEKTKEGEGGSPQQSILTPLLDFLSHNAIPLAVFALSSITLAALGVYWRRKRMMSEIVVEEGEEEIEIPEIEVNVEDYKVFLNSIRKGLNDAMESEKIEELESAIKLGIIYSKRMEAHPPLILSAVETIRNTIKKEDLLKSFEEVVKEREKEIDYLIKKRNQCLEEIVLELSHALGLTELSKAREFIKNAKRKYKELEEVVEKEIEMISEFVRRLRGEEYIRKEE